MSGEWPVEVARGWHPLAALDALRARPVARRLMGVPLVLFLGGAKPVVMLDRCPHRGMRLSGGRVRDGVIACPYHGWRFGPDGRCVEVPGSREVADAVVRTLPVVVRAGLVWTSLAAVPPPFPRLPELIDDPALDHFRWLVEPSRMRLLDGIENLLDALHPHHVHPWFLRGGNTRRAVQVEVTLGPDGAEAVYHEDAPPGGLLSRLFEGHRSVSIGRYFPPTIAQVELRSARGLRVSLTAIFVPEDTDVVRPYALFATPRGLVPAWLKRWLLKAINLSLLRQDQRVLARQAEALAGCDKPEFATGPGDLIGPTIWRLANGLPQPPEQRSVTLYL